VQSIRTGERAYDLDIEQLALRAAGAHLPQPKLPR
jgi:hypothetical protein